MARLMKHCLPWAHEWEETGSIGNIIFLKCSKCSKEIIRFAK